MIKISEKIESLLNHLSFRFQTSPVQKMRKFYYRIGFRTLLYVYVLNFRRIESILNHLGF